jgi:hypothetical protein
MILEVVFLMVEFSMFIPRSVAQLTGWKAVVGVIVIVGIVGVSMWAKMEPRSVSNGTWDIQPGMMKGVVMEASKSASMKVECVPTAGGDQQYMVYVLDEASETLSQTNPAATITPMAQAEGTGTLTIQKISVMRGKYYVIVENHGQSTLSVKYRVYELSN